ncbi:MAG: hypothetical protein AB4060_15640 [Crocosphaera sp.]
MTSANNQSTVPDAGNSLEEAQDLGLFSYSITNPLTIPIFTDVQEVVGGDDSDDYFQFSLDNTAGVSVAWTSSESITVELLDNNGTLIKSVSPPSFPGVPFTGGSLFENLNPGTYYLNPRLRTSKCSITKYIVLKSPKIIPGQEYFSFH